MTDKSQNPENELNPLFSVAAKSCAHSATAAAADAAAEWIIIFFARGATVNCLDSKLAAMARFARDTTHRAMGHGQTKRPVDRIYTWNLQPVSSGDSKYLIPFKGHGAR
jgi:hypothetical protein